MQRSNVDEQALYPICRFRKQRAVIGAKLRLIPELAGVKLGCMFNEDPLEVYSKSTMLLPLVCRCLRVSHRIQWSSLPLCRFQPAGLRLLQHRTYAESTENLPRVAQPSVWHSMVPKAFRSQERSNIPTEPRRSKDWNPATFFICIFLLIGSNAIQMLTLRNEYSSFSRKAETKIALLKEVLDKVQRGEQVDVEKVLGTGDEEQEQEWADGRDDIVHFDLCRN